MATHNRQAKTDSFRVATSGLIHATRSQPNFQLQLTAGLLVLIAAAVFGFSRIEWLILIITVSLVLVAELLNTVVEVVVDLAVKERLIPEAKLAKDVSAAAVLLMSFFAVVTGVILFAPHVQQLLG